MLRLWSLVLVSLLASVTVAEAAGSIQTVSDPTGVYPPNSSASSSVSSSNIGSGNANAYASTYNYNAPANTVPRTVPAASSGSSAAMYQTASATPSSVNTTPVSVPGSYASNSANGNYVPAAYPSNNSYGGSRVSSNNDVQLAQRSGTPDLLSFGIGYVDFDKDEDRTQAANFRFEYRWGYSLWSYTNNSWFDFGIHPLAGVDISTLSQLYGFGGFAFDLLFYKHIVFTESEAVGLFDSGDAKPLGSFIEFRSQAELGWRFDNDMRITGQVSHISNAGLTKHNPGEEIIGAYVHIPMGMVFGHRY